jgi:hypothetical protein
MGVSIVHCTDKSETKVPIILHTLNEEEGIGKVLAKIPVTPSYEVIVGDSSIDINQKIAANIGARSFRNPPRVLEMPYQQASNFRIFTNLECRF